MLLTRRGNEHAFEALVNRYQARLLAFCRHMLGSKEDAEDVLQEVFASAYRALCSDERAIQVKPWLYKIARNRCLNHIRRIQPICTENLDLEIGNQGRSAADTAHEREEFRQLVGDVKALPEMQRTALLLREIEALSYDQIASALDTTVPSVKSLLVRARVGLAEAAESRNLTCEEVRDELGAAAEGLMRVSPPVKRHLRECDRCAGFQSHLKSNNKALSAFLPIGPLIILKKIGLQFGAGSASFGGTAAVGSVAGGGMTAGLISTGITAVAGKTVAGITAAAIVTAGAVDVSHTINANAKPAITKPSTVAAAPELFTSTKKKKDLVFVTADTRRISSVPKIEIQEPEPEPLIVEPTTSTTLPAVTTDPVTTSTAPLTTTSIVQPTVTSTTTTTTTTDIISTTVTLPTETSTTVQTQSVPTATIGRVSTTSSAPVRKR